MLPSARPSTNHLNPTGTSTSLAPSDSATRSIMLLLTSVLPIPACFGHCLRLLNRYEIATAR